MKKYWFPAAGNPMWNMHSIDFVKLLGSKNTKLPPQAIQPRIVQAMERKDDGTVGPVGVTVWADEAPTGPRKNATHRVKCKCPGCGDIVSAGRLFQHKCYAPRRSAKELARARG